MVFFLFHVCTFVNLEIINKTNDCFNVRDLKTRKFSLSLVLYILLCMSLSNFQIMQQMALFQEVSNKKYRINSC